MLNHYMIMSFQYNTIQNNCGLIGYCPIQSS